MRKVRFRVGVLGATGMVGQRFVSLLSDHPWFNLTVVAASTRSAGQSYAQAVAGRWSMPHPIPPGVGELVVRNAAEVGSIAAEVDFVFCAVDLPKAETRALEDDYAKHETPVVSNNSAHRGTADVPVIIPEVNPEHAAVIEAQRRRLGTRRGFVVAKPNCSVQSYVPVIHPLREFGPTRAMVATYQAVSGAGRTLDSWPEMRDNIIPFIAGEEEKSEQEPLKIWGAFDGERIVPASRPSLSAQCVRVPVSDGHLAVVFLALEQRASREEIIARWRDFRGRPQQLGLPSAPEPLLTYFDEDDRPQTRLDRDLGRGMGIAVGRLRPDRIFDYRLVALSHNTVRGAAGGAVLTAELLAADGYLEPK